MNRIAKLFTSVFVLAVIVSGVGVTTAKANTLSQILKTMEAHKNALQTLKANIKMKEFESAIEDEEVRQGDVVYIPRPGKDALVRVDWKSPNETLIVANKKYVLYRVKLNQAIVGSINGSKQKSANNALAFMSMSKEELQRKYKVQFLGTVKLSGSSVWHLRLTPRGKENFKTSELYVDKNGMPVQAVMLKHNKDMTTVTLSSLNKNTTIDMGVFNISSELKRRKTKIIDG